MTELIYICKHCGVSSANVKPRVKDLRDEDQIANYVSWVGLYGTPVKYMKRRHGKNCNAPTYVRVWTAIKRFFAEL